MGTRKGSTQGAGLAAALERRAVSLRRLTGPHVGVDVVDIARWEGRLKLGGEALRNRIYTEAELRFAAGRGLPHGKALSQVRARLRGAVRSGRRNT